MRSKARIEAEKRYKAKTPEKQRHYQYKSKAKAFVKKYATDDELIWLKDLIDKQINNCI